MAAALGLVAKIGAQSLLLRMDSVVVGYALVAWWHFIAVRVNVVDCSPRHQRLGMNESLFLMEYLSPVRNRRRLISPYTYIRLETGVGVGVRAATH